MSLTGTACTTPAGGETLGFPASVEPGPARVSSIDTTTIGDHDEPRRRVRLRAAASKTKRALSVDPPTYSLRRSSTRYRLATTATPKRASYRFVTEGRTRAEIGALVGQRSLK